MTISTRKRVLGGLLAASVFVALAGCAAPPPETDATEEPGGGAVEGFLPCMVSGTGGFDDKSFNQLGLEGLEQASEDLGVENIAVESNTTSDFAPNIQSVLDQNCTLVVTVGFDLAAAAAEAAQANPEVQFVSVDDIVDTDFDGETDFPNIKPVIFDTAQAAFLAGYASASYSKSKVVGTYGGKPFPTVTIFMDGFKQGVDYWNEQKGDTVKVLGWDGTDGVFTDAFVPDPAAENAVRGLIDQGADVILPVGGGIYLSAASVIRDSGKDVALLGVDADVFETDPSVADLLLTSIRKAIDVGVSKAIIEAGEGNFDATPYVGVLEDEGVGIAPFHDFEDKVSPDLQGELDTITAGIIDGSIPVTSYLSE
ncbi:MAG TPA: BMP family ABC transporter substrate-binding protein [Microbacterium sp.]|uniref:BMP family lipoprotein n=1 Tax=Microbacterium sp. TaxID=51671 RepID=UPI002CD2B0AE|nr:BMP family ABC transporter substrate-binding protein [Microbacterium sp.]HWI29878.1 BMP family ABC transporter substrate-binding protein [Microbacterium sp.]